MYIIEENYIYEETENKKQLVGNVNRLMLTANNTAINTLTNINLEYQVFDLELQQYITDTSISKTVNIYVDNVLATTESIIDGAGNIEFESAEAGTFVIRVENSTCEVVVNG